MKNIIAVLLSFILFSVLITGHLSVSLYYLNEVNPKLDSYLANILQPILVVIAGYVCVSLSSTKKWWFSGAFALTTYIFFAICAVLFGPGLDVSNWGLSALVVPVGLVVFSLLGGGIYQYKSAKH